MVPAVPVGSATLSHSLDENAQLLQAHVGPGSHANDADAQALGVCGAKGKMQGWREVPSLNPRSRARLPSGGCPHTLGVSPNVGGSADRHQGAKGGMETVTGLGPSLLVSISESHLCAELHQRPGICRPQAHSLATPAARLSLGL